MSVTPTNPADDTLVQRRRQPQPGAGFDLAGNLIQGYDATTIDPSMSSLSGHAVGRPLLYLANNGGGQVFRTDKSANPLGTGLPFAAAEKGGSRTWSATTAASRSTIWIRHTPQGVEADDLFTANEIEAQTCFLGGGPPPPPPPPPPPATPVTPVTPSPPPSSQSKGRQVVADPQGKVGSAARARAASGP